MKWLNLGITPAKRYQARAGELIVKELGLKRHLKDNKETLYFYNENLILTLIGTNVLSFFPSLTYTHHFFPTIFYMVRSTNILLYSFLQLVNFHF